MNKKTYDEFMDRWIETERHEAERARKLALRAGVTLLAWLGLLLLTLEYWK